ncbi:ABC transporter ATP-binding protein [Pseudooceanicola sediminis]|uniref:ABC transporter ATP-binding protein n=1 Tax=Pseudooceanicola sediminis TaxID=2211117 RepID=A0A399J3Y5_9RHOB|nr:ABC transporter ATP-binding protein [Pseudooceanicola sediminis]KAA2313855.1 ABC transporter ATP-binding protein [Puniceibacterium sp. HSS470]RII38672.1 ABC transporter ATP-binding protein [Pseudooceanicola sediminis]|tara:strand:- start:36745 stop:37470 length:726 start_codon:yes stop_codon:yes gene_type:complete
MSDVILSTKGLSKSFDGLRANHDINFALHRHEVHALIGPNGAGKTTFVSMLIGRLRPTSGVITFEGRDVTRLGAQARVQAGMAYTFQITSVFAKLSCHENVALAARRLGGDVEAEVASALSRVGLGARAGEIAGDLSYGHQRLLEIAMGLAQRPALLILDEPTQGLAESEIAGFKALIRGLATETTILLIEHNMSVVMELADRITVLNFGEVLAQGTPQEIHQSAEVQSAYLGTGGDDAEH